MNQGLIPRRYAKALYKVAVDRKCDKALYGQMQTLSNAFVRQPRLQEMISNPFVDDDDKKALLLTAADAGQDDAVFPDFISLLQRNRRIDMARGIAMAYLDIYRKTNGIYLVEVVSAAEMEEAEEKRLKKIIVSHLKGGTMEYTHRVDPGLIGGFVVNVDSERLDASVKNELKQLRLKLLSN